MKGKKVGIFQGCVWSSWARIEGVVLVDGGVSNGGGNGGPIQILT